MMWGKRWRKETIDEKLRAAEEALLISQIGYMAAETMDREATKLARGHRRVQHENHISEKMFGART